MVLYRSNNYHCRSRGMEKLFLILTLSVLCVACEKMPKREEIRLACGETVSSEEFTDENDFIPWAGGFWPCDWVPHPPHAPTEDNGEGKMV